MTQFPRTNIESLSVSRLIIGTNWFLGYSHTSLAKDRYIRATMGADAIADILEVFLSAGVNTVLGVTPLAPHLDDAIKDAEDRTGERCYRIGTPIFDVSGNGGAPSMESSLDQFAAIGTDICMPHQAATDALLDRTTRSIRNMDAITRAIRERGMIPGLSTHMPETIPYADETGLDVATYIQIYNAVGFLMQVEVDWVHRLIWGAKKPVLTIKPLAAGRLLPLPGLAFAWATLREQDMVSVGTMTPDEAREVIELSMAMLERRMPNYDLQRTRSKRSLDEKACERAAKA